jgi:hypothetical protein
MAQGVGEHEGIEPVVFGPGNLVALSRPCRDPRAEWEDKVTVVLEVFDK